MPCEGCGAQFGLVRRRRACPACWRACCGACLRRGAGRCEPCSVLSSRPLLPVAAAELRIRDLQLFLRRRGVDTSRCLEKEELVTLAVQHVNGITFQQSDPRPQPQPSASSSTFSSLKDFTNNINELITSAFDLRSTPAQEQAPPRKPSAAGRVWTWTAAGAETSRAPPPPPTGHPPPPPPTAPPPPPLHTATTPPPHHTETEDCFEIVDLHDGGLETGAEGAGGSAAPLPADCDVLLTEVDTGVAGEEGAEAGAEGAEAGAEGAARTDRDEDTAALGALSARALKRLLARNGVEFRGCVEREELEARGRTLLEARRAERARGEPPSEDACKICLNAPLEVLLLECGHMVACAECARRLAECPVCRRYVARVVRVFRA